MVDSRSTIVYKKGFTLIELLIVISIIAILVTAIVASFGGTQDKARDARRREDLDAIKKALELFKSDTPGSTFYPASIYATGAGTIDDYIRDVPKDPSNLDPLAGVGTAGRYIYTPLASGGGTCSGDTVSSPPSCTTYTLVACIQNNNTPAIDGVGIKNTVAPELNCPGTKVYRVVNP